MSRPWMMTLVSGLLALASAVAQEETAKAPKKPPAREVRGVLGPKQGGAGFVYLNGNIFIEAIVIHNEKVESGIFHVDTGTPTGCVMETYFAEKLGVIGLGNVTLKLADAEIKFVKATVLDHPDLQQIFKDNNAVFQNRPICGVIGYPALAATQTVIDFENMLFRFLPPLDKMGEKENKKSGENEGAENPGGPPGRLAVPFQDDGRILWLKVRLNDKEEGMFLASTGSPFSWIRKETASKATLRKGKPPRSMKVDGVELSPVTLDLRILKKYPEYKTAPFPVVGCLGTDFFRDFRITIDAINKRLLLDPLPAPKKVQPPKKSQPKK